MTCPFCKKAVDSRASHYYEYDGENPLCCQHIRVRGNLMEAEGTYFPPNALNFIPINLAIPKE